MRVAVTGGTGFLGAHLARALAQRGDQVTCLDVITASPLLDGDVDIVRCDMGSWSEVLAALGDLRPDVVFHSAGILSAAAESRHRAAYQANVTGTYNLLEVAGAVGIPRVVFTSTIATYGPGVAEAVSDDTPQRPTTMYGVSKVLGELLGEYYAHRFGLDFRALRLPSVIGAGRGPGGASAYSSIMVSEPAQGRPYVAPVNERARIPIVYIKDAVAALVQLAETDASRLRHGTYGMPGLSPTAGELAAAVRMAIPGAEIGFSPDPDVMRIVDSWPRRVDGSAALRDWDWVQTRTLPDLVADFVAEVSGAEPLVQVLAG